jgi:hypothetical protein
MRRGKGAGADVKGMRSKVVELSVGGRQVDVGQEAE